MGQSSKLSTILLIAILVNVNFVDAKVSPSSKIKKIILMCMENHSYDNLLGFMPPPIGDLDGTQFQYLDPTDPTSQKYYVHRGANYRTSPDPPHGFDSVNQQLFGINNFPLNNSYMPNNSGFAYTFKNQGGDPQTIMNIYAPEQVPIISSLAANFTTFNRWFCSVPSCTNPNKYFLYSASSGGRTNNPPGNPLNWEKDGFPIHVKTIFENLKAENVSWSIHFMDWDEVLTVYPTDTYVDHYVMDINYNNLYKKMKEGTLDTFTYLIPAELELTFLGRPPNTQHPSQDIRNGEQLIKEVYENLRNSPSWNETLLLITYDEHGGFYDSVPPTRTLKNPDPSKPGYPNNFDFDRSGPRVPAIAISPWLPAQVNSTIFEHASIPATLKTFLNLSSPFLNERDANANVFLYENLLLDEPRTDCPTTLPDVFPSWSDVPRLPTLQLGQLDDQIDAILHMLMDHHKLLSLQDVIFLQQQLKSDELRYQFLKEYYHFIGIKVPEPVEFYYLKPYLVQ